MAINLDTIPVNLMLPGTYVEVAAYTQDRGLPVMPRSVLLLGQKTGGNVPTGVIERVTRVGQGADYFGPGSSLGLMADMARAANPFGDIYALALADNPAGVAARFTHTFTGAASAARAVPLYSHGRKLATVSIAAGDSAASIADKIAAAVNASQHFPFTAGAAANVLTLTAKEKGEVGNDLGLYYRVWADEGLPAGVTYAIAQTVQGSGNPDIMDALGLLGDRWLTDIATPWRDSANLNGLRDFTTGQWSGMVMKDVMAYHGLPGSYGAASTFLGTRNHLAECFMPTVTSPTPAFTWAAVIAAVCAFEATQDPARPLQTVLLPGILPPPPEDRLDDTERNLMLLVDGGSTFTVDAAGQVRIEYLRTTYKETANGAPDATFRDVEDVANAAYIRYAHRVTLNREFPRHKLADDVDDIEGRPNVARPKDVKAALVRLGERLLSGGHITDLEFYKSSLVAERDSRAGGEDTVLVRAPIKQISQLRRTKLRAEVTY